MRPDHCLGVSKLNLQSWQGQRTLGKCSTRLQKVCIHRRGQWGRGQPGVCGGLGLSFVVGLTFWCVLLTPQQTLVNPKGEVMRPRPRNSAPPGGKVLPSQLPTGAPPTASRAGICYPKISLFKHCLHWYRQEADFFLIPILQGNGRGAMQNPSNCMYVDN